MSTYPVPVRKVDPDDSQFSVVSELSSSKGTVELRDVPSRALQERYRCPEGFLRFSLGGDLAENAGYFRFGPDVTAFGRSCSGRTEAQANSSLEDVLGKATVRDGAVVLPFAPDEIIENLRLERYIPNDGAGSQLQAFLRRLYYWVRPLTSLSTRRLVQKFHARNWGKEAFPNWPVDTTVENFCERLLLLALEAKGIDRVPFVWFWPKGAQACLTMTHDVETAAGRDFCSSLMDVDEVFGIRSSFQIVPQGRYSVSPELLTEIRRRGFEVGIQDFNHDGRLYDDREEFLRRAQKINQYAEEYGAKGFRSAVLYRRPDWYGAFNFCYDTSIPSVAHLDPQRGGCCSVMPYFIGGLIELPVTTVQDYTLFHLLGDYSIDLWKTQTELILRKNGLVSFIVHPDYVDEPRARQTYESLLRYLQELRARTSVWFALPGQIETWWRARSRMRVVNHGGRWRIEGEATQNAALAYARLVDGRLVYEIEGLESEA